MLDELPVLSVRLFGTPEVRYTDSNEVLPLSRPAMNLLARLLYTRGRPLSRTELADALWPEMDDLTARDNNLRQHLASLRRLLGERLREEGKRGSQTVGLAPASFSLDAHRFEEAIASGRYQDALDLQQGELLPGVALPWAEEWRDAGRRHCRHALVELAEAAARRKDDAEALTFLERALKSDPFDEELVRRQMTLLAESGRVSDALSRYDRFRDTLGKEFPGIRPQSDTEQLYQSLRKQLRRPAASPTVEEKSGDLAATCILPIPLTSLVGRESVCQEMLRALRAARLVTVVGGGGLGKTRLALEVGHRLEANGGAIRFVDFAPLARESPVAVLERSVAEALEIQDAGEPERGRRIRERIGGQEALLVFDNCEHVRESARELARGLLIACPHLRILATSREPLGLTAEYVVSLPPLSVPTSDTPEGLQESESGRLFLERAGLRIEDLAPWDVTDAVILCQRLDGVPLAIELAAKTLVRFGALDALVADLDAFLQESTASPTLVDELGRPRSLPSALSWSDQMLSPDERRLFYRLSLLCGGGYRETVVGLAESAQGAHWLDELIYKSLAVAERDGYGTRYRLLEPVREYAYRRLTESGDAEAATLCHARWFKRWTEHLEDEKASSDQAEWLRRLDRERPNLEAAIEGFLEVGEPGEAARLAARHLWRFWETRGWWQEGRRCLDRILTVSDHIGDTQLRAELSLRAGLLQNKCGNTDEAERCLNDCIALCRQIPVPDAGSCTLEGKALNGLGMIAQRRGDLARSSAFYEAALPLWTETGDEHGYAAIYTNLGINYLKSGDAARALPLFEEALTIRKHLKDEIGEAAAWNCLGAAATELGDLERGERAYQECLRLSEYLNNRTLAAHARINLGEIVLSRGNLSAAALYLDTDLDYLRATEDEEGIAENQVRRAEVALKRGDCAAARANLREALYFSRRNEAMRGTITRILDIMALLAKTEGDRHRAWAYLRASDALHVSSGTPRSGVREQEAAVLRASLRKGNGEGSSVADSSEEWDGEVILRDAEAYLLQSVLSGEIADVSLR